MKTDIRLKMLWQLKYIWLFYSVAGRNDLSQQNEFFGLFLPSKLQFFTGTGKFRKVVCIWKIFFKIRLPEHQLRRLFDKSVKRVYYTIFQTMSHKVFYFRFFVFFFFAVNMEKVSFMCWWNTTFCVDLVCF